MEPHGRNRFGIGYGSPLPAAWSSQKMASFLAEVFQAEPASLFSVRESWECVSGVAGLRRRSVFRRLQWPGQATLLIPCRGWE